METGDFFETLVCDAPDAIVYADERGVIRFWNRGAERIFGFAEAEALGQTLDLIVPENLRGRHWQGYAATMQSGKTRYGAGEIPAVPAMRKRDWTFRGDRRRLKAGQSSRTGVATAIFIGFPRCSS
jgi:PAS domain-containing protein